MSYILLDVEELMERHRSYNERSNGHMKKAKKEK